MWAHLARRLLAIPPLLLAISFLTHVLLCLAPGDYLTRLAADPTVSAESLALARTQLGLDGGVLERYLCWLRGAVHLDFGHSFKFGLPVGTLIAERLGNTLLLTGTALLVTWGLAVPMGLAAGMNAGRLLDRFISLASTVGLSIPRIFLALLFVMFAASTGLFPTGGMRDQVRWDDFTGWEKIVDVAWHLVLPVAVIALVEMAALVRQMRAEVIEVSRADFVRTAQAKGLHPLTVATRHLFPAAVNPLVSLFGLSLASLLTGSFLVEIVFSWPGLAGLTVDAMLAQDEPVVMAAVVMAAVMLVAGNLVADLLLTVIDPRIRIH